MRKTHRYTGRQAKAEVPRERFNGDYGKIKKKKFMDEGRIKNSKTNSLPLRLTSLYDTFICS